MSKHLPSFTTRVPSSRRPRAITTLGLGAALLLALPGCSHVAHRAPASETETLEATLANTRQHILGQRKADRYWSGVFTSDATNDAIVLALGHKIGRLTPELRESFLQSMTARMSADRRGWPAIPDGAADPHVTAVVLVCLKSLGLEADPRFSASFEWFNSLGGEAKISFFALQMLAPLDLIPQGKLPPISPRIFGLPQFLPFQIEKLGFPRAFTVPFVTLVHLAKQPDGSLLARRKTLEQWKSLKIKIGHFKLRKNTAYWADQGLAWTLQNQNSGQGWCATIATLLGIRLLQEAERVGLGDFQSQIDQAWSQLLTLRVVNQDGQWVQQPMGPGIWDTASVLLGFESLKDTPWELPRGDAYGTVRWLLERAARDSVGAGWAFDESDTSNPDVDDTAHVVHALLSYGSPDDATAQTAAREGLKWVLAHQNRDGGFPAWTKNASPIMAKIMHLTEKVPPFEDFSQSDITGRVLYTLAEARHRWPEIAPKLAAPMERACDFLRKKQPRLKGTSLYLSPGHWMVNYVYTAANVLAGYATAGCHEDQAAAIARWIVSTQQEDGGWGESDQGYASSRYVADSTKLSQTGVALTGLILYYEHLLKSGRERPAQWLHDSIDRGVRFLIARTGGGRSFAEREFTGVLIKGTIYGRYELLPAYTALYVLGRWQRISAAATDAGSAPSGSDSH